MENFHRILGLLLLFLPGIFVAMIGSGPVDVIYPITFFILFALSITYHLWLFKKYGSSIPESVKKTHKW